MTVRLPLFYWGVLALGLIVASVYDIKVRRVPNWLSVGLLTSGVVSRYLTSGSVEAGWSLAGSVNAGWGLAGSAVGLLLLLFPYSRSWIGGGDVKLLTATGSWLGPQLVLYTALFGSLAAGLISLLYLLRSPKDVRRQVLLNLKLTFMLKSVPEMPEAADRAHNLSPPLAPAIAMGTLATVCLYYVDVLVLYRV